MPHDRSHEQKYSAQKASAPRESAPRESAPRNTHAKVFALLAAYQATGRLLEIPCGSGAFLQRLADGPWRPIGVDLDPRVLATKTPSVRADMDEPLPVATGSMDAVVSIEGLEHIRRPFDFVREARRVLKPGGHLFLTTPNISSARSRWRCFVTGFHNKAKYPLDECNPALRHHINPLPFPTLRYMLHTQGFDIVEVATNRVKVAAWLYLPWWPIQQLACRHAFRRAHKNPEHRSVIGDVRRQMASWPVFMGETIILVARAR